MLAARGIGTRAGEKLVIQLGLGFFRARVLMFCLSFDQQFGFGTVRVM